MSRHLAAAYCVPLRHNRTFMVTSECTGTQNTFQPNRKWVEISSFNGFGMWPPGVVFRWAEQMILLLDH